MLLTEFTSMELSQMLICFLQNCFPTRLQTFNIAESVSNRLEKNDPVLFEHINKAMQRNVAFDPREFLVNFIHQEKEKATTMGPQDKSIPMRETSGTDNDSRSLLSHPIIFMRKWIGEVSGN